MFPPQLEGGPASPRTARGELHERMIARNMPFRRLGVVLWAAVLLLAASSWARNTNRGVVGGGGAHKRVTGRRDVDLSADYSDDEGVRRPRAPAGSSRRGPSPDERHRQSHPRRRDMDLDEDDEDERPMRSDRGETARHRKHGASGRQRGAKHQPSAPAGPSRWAGLQGRAKVWLREAKAALSSELEGVITKATRPDDKQVKLKHLEPLLAISYQTAPQVDPYAPVLRKLWAKMMEGDHRTALKALYILHRLSANGAAEHAMHLQSRLCDMARVQDSRTSALYFRVESMALEGRAFAGEYAAYVIFRASHFSPGFAELTRLGGGGGEEGEGPMGPREAAVTLERLQETLRRALLVRLQMDEVTELSSMCAEALFFDVQQVLDIVADLLSSASPLSPALQSRLWALYQAALGAVNAFVGHNAELVATHGVTMREMKSVVEERRALTSEGHPLIEEAESSDEAGPLTIDPVPEAIQPRREPEVPEPRINKAPRKEGAPAESKGGKEKKAKRKEVQRPEDGEAEEGVRKKKAVRFPEAQQKMPKVKRVVVDSKPLARSEGEAPRRPKKAPVDKGEGAALRAREAGGTKKPLKKKVQSKREDGVGGKDGARIPQSSKRRKE